MFVGAIVHLVKRRASDRKVADSRFDSRTGNASLRGRKRHCLHISDWSQAVYPLWSILTKDLQTNCKNGHLAQVSIHRRRCA